MNVLDAVAATVQTIARSSPRASDEQLTLEEWAAMFELGALPGGMHFQMGSNREEIEQTFPGLVAGAYAGNGVVFAAAMTRSLLFSQARILFQQLRGGQPGDLFGTPDLGILEKPWPGASTVELLTALDLDAQFAGTGVAVRRPGRIERLMPHWCALVYGSVSRPDVNPWDPDAELVGLQYVPGGFGSGEEPISFTAGEVALYAPASNPMSRWLGIPWVLPVIRDVLGDKAAMSHKLSYFEHAATPQLVIKSSIADTKKWREWVAQFRQQHEGASQAYRTLHLQAVGQTDVEALGNSMRQVAFKETMGHGETRLVAASGMHPVLVALSEGLQGASLNAGNFAAAARNVGNAKIRPWWGKLAGVLEKLVPALPGTRLWYDDRQVSFLAEDIKDAAEVQSRQGSLINAFTREGFTAASAIDAVTSGDLRRLVHTGYVSVQLQLPGTSSASPAPDGASTTSPVGYVEIPGMRTPTPVGMLPKLVGERRAVRDFWPASGLLTEFGPVDRGTVLEAVSPYVRTFPSLFEVAEEDLGARAVRLRGAGHSVPQIASELDRTERHVRRLLAAGTN